MSDAGHETAFCRGLLNYARYPIDEPGREARRSAVDDCRRSLAADGCAVIRGFLGEEGLKLLLEEATARQHYAHFARSNATNIYFTDDDSSLPKDHPRRIFFERTNGFVTSDHFGKETASRRLYYGRALTRFIADCLGKNPL